MSASVEESKIDVLDDEETVNRKIKNAYCVAGEVENNGVLAFLKYVIMTVKHDKKEDFVINRDKKYGGDLKFKDYDELEKAYVNKIIHPLDLKNAVAKEINLMLKLIRANINILKEYSKKAYSKWELLFYVGPQWLLKRQVIIRSSNKLLKSNSFCDLIWEETEKVVVA